MNFFWKIYTDGGARGNPGPAAGAFVVVEDGHVIHKDSKFLGKATNNEAEYNAVILALYWLVENKEKLIYPEVLFVLDSELVVRQLTGIYRVKSKNLKTLIIEINNIRKNIKDINIIFHSVKREKNILADRLVNQELDENQS